jgi:GT2 family glycosyltransferase
MEIVTGAAAPIAVVVPNWNGASRIEACVRSLVAQDDDLEIVVVDNGSVDESLAVLAGLRAELGPQLVVLRQPRNLGFAGGVNCGIAYAIGRGAPAVALFNNDAVADRRWLGALAAELEARPEVAVVTGRLLMADGRTVDSTGDFYTEWGLPYPRDRDAPSTPVRPSGEVFGGSGGASLYRTALFADIGLFDERFFAYLEDVDVGFRARLAGYRAYYSAQAVAYHDQGSTSRTLGGFGARQYFRNLPLLLVKNVPLRLWPRVVPRFALVYALMILNLFRRGTGLDAVRGALGALRLLPGGLRARRGIQGRRRLDDDALDTLLWPGLPPNMRVLRGTRDRLRRLVRMAPHVAAAGDWRPAGDRQRRVAGSGPVTAEHSGD